PPLHGLRLFRPHGRLPPVWRDPERRFRSLRRLPVRDRWHARDPGDPSGRARATAPRGPVPHVGPRGGGRRLGGLAPPPGASAPGPLPPATLPPGDPLAPPHHSLESVRASAGARWRCRRCGADLGDAAASYKRGALRAIRTLGQVSDAPLPAGDFIGELHEYYCPGFVALLQVDVFCPTLGDDALLHDIALAMVARAPQPA